MMLKPHAKHIEIGHNVEKFFNQYLQSHELFAVQYNTSLSVTQETPTKTMAILDLGSFHRTKLSAGKRHL